MGIPDTHRYGQLVSMRAFLAVAETGSFSGAGRKLGMHGSTISKLIRKLESRLNVKLFQRTTRYVQLTEAGDLYFSGLSKVIDELDYVSDEFFLGAQSLTGEVRIGISSIVGSAAIGPLLDEFSRRYPAIRSVTKISDHPFDIVEYGVSVAIIPIHWRTPGSYVRRNLCTYRYTLMAPDESNTVATSTRVASDARFIVHGDINSIGVDLEQLDGSRAKNLIETSNIDLQKKLIVRLRGIGVLPNYDAEQTWSEDGIRSVSDIGQERHEICLVYATRVHLPRTTRAFIDHAIDFFTNFPR